MDNPLSAHLRRLILGLDPGKPWGIVGGLVFLAGLIWLGVHIIIQRDKHRAWTCRWKRRARRRRWETCGKYGSSMEETRFVLADAH